MTSPRDEVRRRRARRVLAATLLVAASHAMAGPAVLRLQCDDDSVDAEVKIDGVDKGECPVDVKLPAGQIRIEARKSLPGDRERTYVHEMRLGEDTVKTLEIVLGPPTFTAVGQKREDERRAAEAVERDRQAAEKARAQAEEQARRDAAAQAKQDALRQLQAAADGGDVAAMLALGRRYAAGDDELARDKARAAQLFKRAADAGSEAGQFATTSPSDPTEADWADWSAAMDMLALPRTNVRTLNLQGLSRVREFAQTDPFFQLPSGGASFNFQYKVVSTIDLYQTGTCTRNGPLAQVDFVNSINDVRYKGDMTALLGGLMALETSGSSGWTGPTSRSETTLLRSIDGTPSAMKAGTRFGFDWVMHGGTLFSKTDTEITMSCGPTRVRLPRVGNVTLPPDVVQLICYAKPAFPVLQRWYFDGRSGCFIRAGV